MLVRALRSGYGLKVRAFKSRRPRKARTLLLWIGRSENGPRHNRYHVWPYRGLRSQGLRQ